MALTGGRESGNWAVKGGEGGPSGFLELDMQIRIGPNSGSFLSFLGIRVGEEGAGKSKRLRPLPPHPPVWHMAPVYFEDLYQ